MRGRPLNPEKTCSNSVRIKSWTRREAVIRGPWIYAKPARRRQAERTCHSDTFFNHFHRVENCPLSRCVKHKSRFSALVFFDDFQGLRKQSQTVRCSRFLPFALHLECFVFFYKNIFFPKLNDVDKRYSRKAGKNKHIPHRFLAFQLESQITDLFQFVCRDASGKGFGAFAFVAEKRMNADCSTRYGLIDNGS